MLLEMMTKFVTDPRFATDVRRGYTHCTLSSVLAEYGFPEFDIGDEDILEAVYISVGVWLRQEEALGEFGF